MRTNNPNPSFPTMNHHHNSPTMAGGGEGKKFEYLRRTYSQGHGSSRSRIFPARSCYFSGESVVLLTCLAASLLILPLILPPLPPPPFILLLLPIGILAVLMILAFMPFHVQRDTTITTYTTYV